MKSNTHIFAAIRNIGDSQDAGTIRSGPLREMILWLATQLGQTTMARRIVIGIGRDEDGARQAIQVAGAGRAKVTNDMRESLNALLAEVDFGDDDSDSDVVQAEGAPAGGGSRDPRDDWKA